MYNVYKYRRIALSRTMVKVITYSRSILSIDAPILATVTAIIIIYEIGSPLY